jgi:hypothetical protein
MLRPCILEHQGSWDQKAQGRVLLQQYLSRELEDGTVQSVIQTSMPGEKVIFGTNIVEEAKVTVRRIQDNLKARKSR